MADQPILLSLDFLYTPSKYPDREIKYYTEVLGGTLLFRVKAMGTEVAAVRMTEQGPLVLLAEHLKGDRPILVYRVENLERAMQQLKQRGWKQGTMLEIPHGPCCSFTAEGQQPIAIYELTRPEANNYFQGRFDE